MTQISDSTTPTPRADGQVERTGTVVVGAGQAGLAAGYHLARRGERFVILDAGERVGDVWRRRWDSLRLFTPAQVDGLPGWPFPAARGYYPTKDEMADYLESYAAHFELPVRTGQRVTRVSRSGDGFLVETPTTRIEAEHVVVAMSSYQEPTVPSFAAELDPSITTIHSLHYRGPHQVPDGDVLVVGAGNSGAEIAFELANDGRTAWLAGRDVGQLPFRPEGWAGRNFLVRLVLRIGFHRVITVRTPIGRKLRPTVLAHSGPLIRRRRSDLEQAGVRLVPRVAGVRGGRPVLEHGQVLDVRSIVWCTGFRPDLSWLDVPLTEGDHGPRHVEGVVEEVPGLYVVGLTFLYSLSSSMVHGVGRDAERIVDHIVTRRSARAPVAV